MNAPFPFSHDRAALAHDGRVNSSAANQSAASTTPTSAASGGHGASATALTADVLLWAFLADGA